MLAPNFLAGANLVAFRRTNAVVSLAYLEPRHFDAGMKSTLTVADRVDASGHRVYNTPQEYQARTA